MTEPRIVIIGGGSAGLACALALHQRGITDYLILEKEDDLGGILNQCIHTGFGLTRFKQEYTGPRYAQRFIDDLLPLKPDVRLGATVLELHPDKTVVYSDHTGLHTLHPQIVVMALGARERTRGNIGIPGDRCVGVWTAGSAQRYLNIDGYLVGRKVFILGSGDIGLIMARRMTLSGATVVGVAELMPYSNGLTRNLVQCLDDFNIPLYLTTTITAIHGRQRVRSVTLCTVDANRRPIWETAREVEVDTVLLSIGLLPDQVLGEQAGLVMDPRTRGPVVDDHLMSSVKGIYVCGNALHIHDLVDWVSLEGERVAQAIADDLDVDATTTRIPITTKGKLGYILPQTVHPNASHLTLNYRVTQPMEKAVIRLVGDGEVQMTLKKTRLHPSEMQRIEIPHALLSKIHYNWSVELSDD
jgi:NADPH-dependent 2,4-dienoyl-CoA reductase/sulfur reductase-like enzyme